MRSTPSAEVVAIRGFPWAEAGAAAGVRAEGKARLVMSWLCPVTTGASLPLSTSTYLPCTIKFED